MDQILGSRPTEEDPDGAGSLTSPVTTYAYDAANQLLSVTDPLGRETSYVYDDLGRRTTLIQPDPDGAGGATAPQFTYTYDAFGNLLTETDPLGNTTDYEYDDLHRVITIEQPDPDGAGSLTRPETTFTYDAVGNRTSLTDPVGNVTSWAYDNLNRVIEEENELEDVRYFEYDAAGNLVEKTDRNGRVTEYAYDDLHRRTTETWKDGANTVNTQSFSYDAAGQLTTADDDYSDYTFTYDDLGRTTVIVSDNGGPVVRLTQGFDAASNRTSLDAEIDAGSGFVNDFENTYTYDDLNRLTKIEQRAPVTGNAVAEKRVDFSYNAIGQFTTITRYKDLAGGSSNEVVETTYAYDDIGRLTDLTHVHDTTTIADYDWTYDAFSRVTQLSFTSLVGNDGTSDYTYDDTNQLTDADHDYQTDEDYEYDENGNRTLTGYTTGDNNQLTSDGTYNYLYDEEGNRTKKTNISTSYYTTYEWDHHNRLTQISKYDDQDVLLHDVVYTYDVFDRRIEKEIDADGAGAGGAVFEHFVYDGEHIALKFDGASSLTNRYLHGPIIDQILADEQVTDEQVEGTIYWPLTDNLGSVRDLVESDGTVANHLTYDAYGNITSESAPLIDHIFAYTGRERDEESDLQYNRARYYDPLVGRWISEDPIQFKAGDPNIQRYGSNNPTTFIDPDGLDVIHSWNWHHVYPSKVFTPERLAEHNLDLEISAPENGVMMIGDDHIGKGGVHPDWNTEWEDFFKQYEDRGDQAPIEEVRKQRTDMMKKYGIAEKIKNKEAYDACMDYDTWRDTGKREAFYKQNPDSRLPSTKEIMDKRAGSPAKTKSSSPSAKPSGKGGGGLAGKARNVARKTLPSVIGGWVNFFSGPFNIYMDAKENGRSFKEEWDHQIKETPYLDNGMPNPCYNPGDPLNLRPPGEKRI